MNDSFDFKRFRIRQDRCAMKVGTDGVLLGAWAREGRGVADGHGGRILDVGCGTGVISLMMAQRFPKAWVTALDIVEDCCRQTRENADESEFAERIEVVNKAFQDYQSGECFSSIVSNPPFFVASMKNPDTMRSVARHADSLPFADLLRGVGRLLAEDGVFSVIVPDECFRQFLDEACFSGLYIAEDVAIKTTQKKPVKRHLLCFTKMRPETLRREEVVLQNADGTRSDWYRNLTKDFYL